MKELYEQYHRLLYMLAYQLTGSAVDAEDAVQDVFEKLSKVDSDPLQMPKAYVCKMVTNRCLDLLKSASKQREQYVGEWLPEPILLPIEEPMEIVIRNDVLSYGMLVLMERLLPVERAVFVLREAFCFDYATVAQLVGKGEANCRKICSRAKGKMGIVEEEFVGMMPINERWIQCFLHALKEGNVEKIMTMLKEDVRLIADGGGERIAAIRPIENRERVSRFLLGILKKAANSRKDFKLELKSLNGQEGIVVEYKEEIVIAILVQLENEKMKNMYLVRNPNKLLAIN